jgi:hypothetical protein
MRDEVIVVLLAVFGLAVFSIALNRKCVQSELSTHTHAGHYQHQRIGKLSTSRWVPTITHTHCVCLKYGKRCESWL